MPKLLYKRGAVWYSKIQFPGHPKADKRGRLRLPLDTDQQLAEKKLGQLLLERDNTKFGPAPRGISWEAWKKRWLAYTEKKMPRETHLRHKASVALVDEFLPLEHLDQLTPEALANLTADMRQEDYEPAGINRVLGSLRSMLEQAVLWQYIRNMDWASVKRERLVDKAPKYFEVGQYAVLLQVAHGYARWAETASMLGFNLGLRPGEIFHAHKSNIERERRLYWVREIPGVFKPKTWEERAIEINDVLFEYLEQLLAELPEDCPYLLGPQRPRSQGVMSAGYGKVVRKAKLKGSLYNLRHCVGAYLTLADVNIRKIQYILGHKDIKSVMVYTKLVPKDIHGVMKKMPEVRLSRQASEGS